MAYPRVIYARRRPRMYRQLASAAAGLARRYGGAVASYYAGKAYARPRMNQPMSYTRAPLPRRS